jgi:hypothetical protein
MTDPAATPPPLTYPLSSSATSLKYYAKNISVEPGTVNGIIEHDDAREVLESNIILPG